jgi:hypothetical protein
LQELAGGAHHHELFCPGSGASRTVPGFLVPIGETLSAQLYTELAAQFMSELGRSV